MLAPAITPKVSVILPVFNGSLTVEQTVRSILNQTLAETELIVIDDGSTDGTVARLGTIEDSRVRVIRLPKNVGRSAARNVGIAEARAPYIAMIDADDVSYADRLHVQVSFMEAHPEIAMCGTWAHVVDPSGRRLEWRQPQEPDAIKRSILRSNPFIHCTIMLRRWVLDETGLFDTSLEPGEDYDLYLRVAARHRVCNLPYFLGEYRSHNGLRYRLREQWANVRVRWKAISAYGYSRAQLTYLATPCLAILMPLRLKLYLKSRMRFGKAD